MFPYPRIFIRFYNEILNKSSLLFWNRLIRYFYNKTSNVLRLNNKAFRNNYNLSDLTKMKLVYYGIYVGVCDISKLDMSKEFDFSRVSPTAEEVVDGKVG